MVTALKSCINSRYFILLLVNLGSFGNYFIYDSPSVLQERLQSDLDINHLEFNLFYSVYSFPNIIIPIFGGYFIDEIGVRIAVVVFTVFVSTGQFLFAFGVSIRSYPVAVTGRAIFGLGGENLNVSCCYFLMKWFKNKNLALAMGITFSITRTASVLNENLLPVIVVYSKSLTLALWVGFSVCLASVLAGIILGYFDKKKSGLEKNEKIAVKFSWFEVKQLSLCFWMVCLNLAFSYASIFCFTNIGSSYLQHRFGFDLIEAGRIISITFIFATVLCPFIGVVVDRFGYLPHCVILANLIITTVHVGFLFVQNSHQPAICIVLIAFLGLGYSIYATCIWSMIPLLIKEELGGLANGISTASYNVGLALGPIGVGLLQGYHNEDNRYHWLGIFLILNGSLALFTSVVIYLLDFKLFRVLKNPPRKNNEEDEKENLKSLINV